MVKTRLLFFVCFTVSLASGIVGAQAQLCGAGPGQIAFGFNFTHTRIHEALLNSCHLPGHKSVPDSASDLILHFDDASVQKAARDDLATMAAAGARFVRLMLWYRIIPLGAPTPADDPLGMVTVSDNQVPAFMAANLQGLIASLREFGYHKTILAFAPVGTAAPFCRRATYGDCFDPRTLASGWHLMRAAIPTALRAAGAMPILFDLGNELCFSPDWPNQTVVAAVRAYLSYILPMVKAAFPDLQLVTSCNGNTAEQLERRLSGVVDFYAEMGLRPAAIDVHIYNTVPKQAINQLEAAQRVAARRLLPFIIGETAIDNDTMFRAIPQLKSAGLLSDLRGVLVWPKRAGTACAIDVAPPFDFTLLNRQMCSK